MSDRRNGCPAIAKMRELVLQLYREHKKDGTLPTNGRFLFYEGEARGWWPKSWDRSGSPAGVVTRALTQLREEGAIPWDAIIDETRELENYTGDASIREGIERELERLRLDPWDGQAPFLIMESRSLGGALRATVGEYRVAFAATNGQVGGFLHTDIVPFLEPGHRILYFGDYDLAGNDIEANTRRVLEHEVAPTEQDLLYNGTFNLGFIAVRRCAEGARLLDWWEERCLGLGFSEGRSGLFVDQKWINLAPGLFEGVAIERHAGCNMAYWNCA